MPHPDNEEHPDYYLKTVDCDKCKGSGVDKYDRLCDKCEGSGELEIDTRTQVKEDAP